jgi:hypothetical protein
MSYLREIMQRLRARHNDQEEVDPPQATSLLEAHLDHYRLQLQRCGSAMLQYEWAWMEEHINSLELCLTQPGMVSTAGGAARVQALLAESHRFQELLEDQFTTRGLIPSRHRAAVVATEHAWELSQEQTRRLWGIEADPGNARADSRGA